MNIAGNKKKYARAHSRAYIIKTALSEERAAAIILLYYSYNSQDLQPESASA